MLFKDISYLELWQPRCSVDKNHMCNFCRVHLEEQFCEIFLNLDQWIRRRCSLKTFLISSSGGPFVRQSKTICAILLECIMRINSEPLFSIWTTGSGGNAVQDISYLELWQPFCSAEQNHLCNLIEKQI